MASGSWEELVRGYRAYRTLPVWLPRAAVPNNQGLLPREVIRAMAERGERAVREVERALVRLRAAPGFPARPRDFTAAHAEQVRGVRRLSRSALEIFWEALILDRDEYTCGYCGRGAWAVWRGEGKRRTLRLVVDHFRPPVRPADRYVLDASLAACASCASLRSGLPRDPFLDELRSLGAAVATRRSPRAAAEPGAGP